MSNVHFPYSKAPLRTIKEIQFGLFAPEEIKRMSVVHVEYPETMVCASLRSHLSLSWRALATEILITLIRYRMSNACGPGPRVSTIPDSVPSIASSTARPAKRDPRNAPDTLVTLNWLPQSFTLVSGSTQSEQNLPDPFTLLRCY